MAAERFVFSNEANIVKFSIKSNDLTGHDKAIIPTQDLIRFTVKCLDKKSSKEPGFVIIDLPLFKAGTQIIEKFQDQFTEIIYENLKDKLPPETQKRCFIVQDGQTIQVDGFHLHQGETLKVLHIDRFATLFSHIYYPYENVEGGNLLFFDYQHLMDDLGLKFSEIFHPGKHGEDRPEEPMLIPSIRPYVTPYIHEVPMNRHCPVLVLVNNFKIAHGVTPIVPKGDSFRREYRRFCYLSKPKPFWEDWILK